MAWCSIIICGVYGKQNPFVSSKGANKGLLLYNCGTDNLTRQSKSDSVPQLASVKATPVVGTAPGSNPIDRSALPNPESATRVDAACETEPAARLNTCSPALRADPTKLSTLLLGPGVVIYLSLLTLFS